MSPADLAALAAHPRCVWLDGVGARAWSGGRSLVGWCEPGDPSLSYDASTGVVTRHADGVARAVGTDVFDVLEAELAAGSPGEQWFGWFGYAARPDLPAATAAGGVPDAVWMRPSRVQVSPGTRGNLTGSGKTSANGASFPGGPGNPTAARRTKRAPTRAECRHARARRAP